MVSANGHLVPEAIVCPPVRTHAPERANRARTRRSLASWQPVDTCGGGGRVYTVSRSIVPSLHDRYVDVGRRISLPLVQPPCLMYYSQ